MTTRQPRRVVNGKGPATVLGASPASPRVIEAVAEILAVPVHMGELQAWAGEQIATAVGAEAAFVTGCAAAGITVAAAAAIGGTDLAQVTTLPQTRHERTEVVIQKAHSIIVGGNDTSQLIRLAGGVPVEVGTASDCADFHLESGLSDRTAAALFVDAERAYGAGTLGLDAVVAQCHRQGVPVVVDAAGTSDPAAFLTAGADLVVFSAHKWLRGPTAGIMAGRADLVDAAFLHGEFGVGRPMKAGKEGIAGALAAIRLWSEGESTRHPEEAAIVDGLVDGLAGLEGIGARAVPTHHDSTAPALVQVDVDPEVAGLHAWQLAERTESMDPSVVFYDYDAPAGLLLLDPTFLLPSDVEAVVAAVRTAAAEAARGEFDTTASPAPRFAALVRSMADWRRHDG